MGEHTPDNCPLKTKVESLELLYKNNMQMHERLQAKQDEYDKEQRNVDKIIYSVNGQFETILKLLTSQSELFATVQKKQSDDYAALSKEIKSVDKRVSDVVGDFKLNDYKTNNATEFIKSLTLGVFFKVIGLLSSVGIIVAVFAEIIKSK